MPFFANVIFEKISNQIQMKIADFIKFIEANDVMTGKLIFSKNENLMDLDFINKRFIDFELQGGDYASGSFINCAFEKVVLKDLSLNGVSFCNCHFVQCKFSNVESDFSLNNCKIEHLRIARDL